jgi:hypothetical protein
MGVVLWAASGVSASEPQAGPFFAVGIDATPTVFSAEHDGSAVPDTYMLTVTNSGAEKTSKAPITIIDTLPAAVKVVGIEGSVLSSSVALSCVQESTTCTYSGQELAPGDSLRVLITIRVVQGASGSITDTASVSGGGARAVSVSQTTTIGSATESLALGFGLADFSDLVSGVDGSPDMQAGDHPFETTVRFGFNNVADVSQKGYVAAGGLAGNEAAVKDVVVDLPPGFLGNPQAIARCPQYDVPGNACPASTQVGVATVVQAPQAGQRLGGVLVEPIYNVVPEAGFPAEFAFQVVSQPVVLYATVNPDTNYGVRVTTPDIPAAGHVHEVIATFFGTPATDPNYKNLNAGSGLGAEQPAFLDNPTGCTTEPQDAHVYLDSWQHPGAVLPGGGPDLTDPNWVRAETTVFPQVTGCDSLQFNPSLVVTPSTTQADEPAGLTAEVNIPQAAVVEGDLGTPALKATTVTLPSGISISPSAADGLEGCSVGQIGLSSASPGACPEKSQIGTARVTTPLLSRPLEGAVFLEAPRCNPCNSADASDGNMFRLFLEVAGSGVVIKKEGIIYANPTTGQLTTTFSGIPQAPVSHIELKFASGLRAGLATPQVCGAYTTTSDLTPWSTPATPDATPSSPFNVGWEEHGGVCPASIPFSPFFEAGTSNPNAGQHSPLTVSIRREDREQDLAGIQVRMPPGLLGSLTGVPLCGEPQADLGTCGEGSRIGSVTVAAGAGGHPFYEHGEVYLTGPYKGAPFGLSVVVPTVAGPFNLGNVVVRSTVNVDVHTAALTVTTEPLPQVIDGVPLRLRVANVTVDRPNFIANPTNCAQQHITATMTGVQGAISQNEVPFAVSGCAGLPFGPKFTASTSGKPSRKNGTSLDVKLSFPKGAQSNIAKVKVDLPRQLPSRLTTLENACPAGTFATDPAACPKGALVGIARASTPILPVILTGPVYFVSHGGAGFPNLVVVLEGYGVRVDLIGDTFISKQGITSSTFRSIPDVQVNSFELYLPQGRGSALAVTGDPCRVKLFMPTAFTAQDGAQLKQNTPITVTGCARTKDGKSHKRAVGSLSQPKGRTTNRNPRSGL